jgi:predicted secreted protein
MQRAFLFLIAIWPAIVLAQPDSLWSRTFGGPGSDGCQSIRQTSDGGYVLAGFTSSFGAGGYDFWLVKTDALGTPIFSRTYGGTSDDICWAVLQTEDGGYLLGGYSASLASGWGGWLVKTNAIGDTLWTRGYGSSHIRYCCYDVVQTPDGGYLLAGCSQTTTNLDGWVVKTDANGNGVWSHSWGGPETERFYHITPTQDGNYVLTGMTNSYGAGGVDAWMVKMSSNGDSLWSRTYGTADLEECHAASQRPNGNFLLGGFEEGVSYQPCYLVETDGNGQLLSQWMFGELANNGLIFAEQDFDGGIIAAGNVGYLGSGASDFAMFKVDEGVHVHTFGGVSWESCACAQRTADGGFVLAGTTESFGMGLMDMWMVKTTSETSVDERVTVNPCTFTLSAYPNPFNAVATITFSLPRAGEVKVCALDVVGRLVQVLAARSYPAGTHALNFKADNLPSGTYFARVQAGDRVKTQKLLLVK